MSEQVKIQKTIYALEQFTNIVDINFSQLANPITNNVIEDNTVTIDEFFSLYDTLYFDIPPSGSNNSHLGLATRSLEFLDLSLEDLQKEIENLREENISLKTQLLAAAQINVGTQI